MQTFTGKQYLKIDIANNFGLDKELWETRLDWFDANESNLENLVNQAEKPALFYAGIQAWAACLKGEPSGYPVSLDATSSGLQLLAVLTGDRKAAEICNVVDTGKRYDAYTHVYQTMLTEVGQEAKLERPMVKEAIMTALYGSTAVPRRVFGDGSILTAFFNIMKTVVPGVWQLNEAMLAFWDATVLVYKWVLPDNYHVEIKVMGAIQETVRFLDQPYEIVHKVNAPQEQGRSLGANTIHSIDGMIVREMTRRCNYNPARVTAVKEILNSNVVVPIVSNEATEMVVKLWKHYKESGYLSMRIIDYINSNNVSLVNKAVVLEMLDSLPQKPFEIMAVHDCFRCLPNYANDMRKQYNNQLYLVSKSNLLEFMLKQITGRHIPVSKLNNTMHTDVLNANYALS